MHQHCCRHTFKRCLRSNPNRERTTQSGSCHGNGLFAAIHISDAQYDGSDADDHRDSDQQHPHHDCGAYQECAGIKNPASDSEDGLIAFLYLDQKGVNLSILKALMCYLLMVTTPIAFAVPEDSETINTPDLDESSPIPSVFNQRPYAEIGGSYEHLTNGYAPWASQYLDVTVPFKEKGLLYTNLLNANRFSQNDTAAYLSYAYPLTYGVVSAEGGYTINPQFLTKDLYGLSWNGRLPYQFNYLLSARESAYLVGKTQTFNMGLDKYIGAYRLAYTLVRSVLDYSERSWLSKFQAQWFAESGHRLGLTYATGHEPMIVTVGNLINIDVVTYQLDGLYRINNTVGITLSAWHAMQGSYYQRNGGQVGVRVAF